MGKYLLVLSAIVLSATVTMAGGLDDARQAVKDLFPEVISEQKISNAVQYRFVVGLKFQQVIKRVKLAYKNRRQLGLGLHVAKWRTTANGNLQFELRNRGGNLTAICRVGKMGEKTALLLSLPLSSDKGLDYRVFKVKPRLHLFPLRH